MALAEVLAPSVGQQGLTVNKGDGAVAGHYTFVPNPHDASSPPPDNTITHLPNSTGDTIRGLSSGIGAGAGTVTPLYRLLT